MINQLQWMQTRETDPYHNLALEEHLLQTVEADAVMLYLWQNRKTVVIGRNQNAFTQCDVQALRADGGCVARRKSGGGAVFHDMGNLNFTFIAHADNYDVARQLDVIVRAVGTLGINAERSGRNDITTLDGKKFSGNAFYQLGQRCCHHGTILVDANTADIARYLTVNAEKLRSKGVESVRARVCNLRDINENISVAAVSDALIQAFGEQYGRIPTRVHGIDTQAVGTLQTQYGSWDWLFGRNIPFTHVLEQRFAWGGFRLELHVEKGRIHDARMDTDALDADYFAGMRDCLRGVVYSPEALEEALRQYAPHGVSADVKQDVIRCMINGMGESHETV